MTDLDRWTALAREPESPWAERLRLLAARIQPGETVIDVGAGGMWLRGMIPASCLYLPVDCVPDAPIHWTLSDWGVDPPDLCGDVVVISGVLEYVEYVEEAFGVAIEWAPRLLLSYAVPVEGEDRAAAGWVNAFEVNDLYAMLRDGYREIETIGWWQGQVLIEARR